jgi:glyceraldehyde 3-phosphate dehydrogenase
MIDLAFVAGRDTTMDEINAAIVEATGGRLKGVLDAIDAPLVSADFNHSPQSSVFDLTQTQVMGGNLVRVLSWYDNEWGFSNRMSDTATVLAGAD